MPDRKFIVYEHIFPNGKKYIGITCQSPQLRWDYGWGYKENVQPMMYRAIQKYGWNNIQHNILFQNLTEQDAKEKERELILLYHTCIKDPNCNGYNMTYGGEGAIKYLTEEDRQAAEKYSHVRWENEHREQKNARQRAYYLQNREAILLRSRIRNKAKREQDPNWAPRIPLSREEKLLRKRDSEKRRLAKMSSEQKEYLRQQKREYYQKHKEKIKIANMNRYYLRKNMK